MIDSSFISEIESGEVSINFADPFIIRFDSNIMPGNVELILTMNSNYYNNTNYNIETEFSLEVLERPLIFGDINNDSFINVVDVVMIVSIILNNGEYNIFGDVNNDGFLNVVDVVMIVSWILNP